jgi:hypothetical protein
MANPNPPATPAEVAAAKNAPTPAEKKASDKLMASGSFDLTAPVYSNRPHGQEMLTFAGPAGPVPVRFAGNPELQAAWKAFVDAATPPAK